MSRNGKTSTNLRRRWDDAIGLSDLSPTEKLVCWTLMVWADFETGECWPSMTKAARYAGLADERSLRRILHRLRDRGVVVYLRKSLGGARRTNLIKLDLKAIERCRRTEPNPDSGSGLNRDPESGFNRDPEAPQPGPARRATGTGATNNRDPGSGEQLRTPNEPPPEPPGPGDGGGGVLASLSGGDQELTAELTAAAYDALIAFGVMSGTAKRLAERHGLAEVEAGIAWVRKNASEADSPAAILVTALRDGTARAALEEAERAKAESAARELHHRRAKRIRELFVWTRDHVLTKGEDQRTRVGDTWQFIESVWPTPEQAAECCGVPDEELLSPNTDGWALLRKLADAATQHQTSAATKSPGV